MRHMLWRFTLYSAQPLGHYVPCAKLPSTRRCDNLKEGRIVYSGPTSCFMLISFKCENMIFDCYCGFSSNCCHQAHQEPRKRPQLHQVTNVS